MKTGGSGSVWDDTQMTYKWEQRHQYNLISQKGVMYFDCKTFFNTYEESRVRFPKIFRHPTEQMDT